MSKKITVNKLTLFGEALFWNILFRIGMFIVPFRYMIPILSKSGRKKKDNICYQAAEVKWGLQCVKRYFPQITNCWSQGSAGMMMLKLRGIPSDLFLGVLKEPSGKMKAHAWLKQENLMMSGGKNHQLYAVVTIIRWGEVINELPKQFKQKNGVITMEPDKST